MASLFDSILGLILNFTAGLSFRGGSAFDLADLGWFQAPRGGCARYPNRFDVDSTQVKICFAAVRFDTISTLF